MFKAIVVCSLVAFASAGLLPDAHGYDAYESHAPANYDFSYSVHDGHTGDVKQQQESRRGDAVQGSYSLVEPDGHKRTVHYADDGHSGFNAVVEREGTVHHQPAVAHAPVAIAHAAPVVHAAPYTVAHSAPVVAHASPYTVAHSAPVVAHASPYTVAHSAPVVAHASPYTVAHAPVAVAHAAPLVSHGSSHAISHQTFSAPVVAHETYAHAPQVLHAAAPAYQTIQPIQHVGYASHGAAQATGYSTVSQVTHHGGYHH